MISTHSPETTKSPSFFKRFGIPEFNQASSILGSVIGGVTSKGAGVVSHANSLVGDATSKVASVATGVVSAVTSVRGAVAFDIKSHISIDAISKALFGNINISPTGTTTSSWGPAKSLGTVDGVTIYCIECGAFGNIAIKDSIIVEVFDPILKDGAVDILATNLNIPMICGFEAKDVKSPTLPFKFQIFFEGIIFFEISDIFIIDPMLIVDVVFQLAVKATGFLEAGVHYKWDNAQAHMDLTNKDASASKYSGWTPSVDKVFNVTGGQIDVKGTLGVPISLGVGVNILKGKVNKNVSITDEPSIQLDTIIDTTSHRKRFGDRNHARDLLIRQDQGQCSNGIQEIISFSDSVQLNVLNLWHTQLATFSTQLFSTCIKTASSPASSSVPTSGGSGVAAPTGSSGTGSSSPSSSAGNSPSPPTAPASTPTA